MVYITVLDKNNTPTGPFTKPQCEAKLQSGEFSPTDLAFVAGMNDWAPLQEVLAAAINPSGRMSITYQNKPTAIVPVDMFADYAGFWLRVGAYFVDGFVLTVLTLCVFGYSATEWDYHIGQTRSIMSAPGQFNPAFLKTEAWFQAFNTVAAWLYFALMESSSRQATLGKMLVGIFVTDLNGERISFGRATGRFFAKILSALTCYIGFLMAGCTERKQALHDMIAGTLVVRR
jgi:uncharacterized RDD family membrane protein YckC